MPWYDHEQPTKRKVQDLTYGGAVIGLQRTFVAHLNPQQAVILAPAKGTDLAGNLNLGLSGAGIAGIGVRVKNRWIGQQVPNGFVELVVQCVEPVARAGGMTFNGTTELVGRGYDRDQAGGLKVVRSYHVASSGEVSLPARGTYLTGDAGATGRVYVHGHVDEDAIPGLYLLVCSWRGIIGRSD